MSRRSFTSAAARCGQYGEVRARPCSAPERVGHPALAGRATPTSMAANGRGHATGCGRATGRPIASPGSVRPTAEQPRALPVLDDTIKPRVAPVGTVSVPDPVEAADD